jgi:hypothetical protein
VAVLFTEQEESLVNLPELIPLRGDFSPEDDAYDLTKPQSYALHPKVGFVARDLYDQWQEAQEERNSASSVRRALGPRRLPPVRNSPTYFKWRNELTKPRLDTRISSPTASGAEREEFLVNLPELIPLRGDFSPEDDAYDLTKPQSYALHPKVGFVARDLYDQWQEAQEERNSASSVRRALGPRRLPPVRNSPAYFKWRNELTKARLDTRISSPTASGAQYCFFIISIRILHIFWGLCMRNVFFTFTFFFYFICFFRKNGVW